MVTWATVCFRPNASVPRWSVCYEPSWADKLYRGIARNTAGDPRLVCLTDFPEEEFDEPIETYPIEGPTDWTCIMEVFRPSMLDVYGGQFVVMGLDTVIVGDLSEVAAYDGPFATPRDPFSPSVICNAVFSSNPDGGSLVWAKWQKTRPAWRGGEMQWMRKHLPMKPDLWDVIAPGQLVSYKAHVLRKPSVLENARAVYFHGTPKPHEIDEPFIRSHWV